MLMTVADYLPSLLAHKPPESYPLISVNITGWLVFSFVYVGFTEEVPFRRLLPTFLMQRTTERIRIGNYDMHAAAVLAVLFALAHMSNFWARPFGRRWRSSFMRSRWGSYTPIGGKKSGSLTAAIIIGAVVSDGVRIVNRAVLGMALALAAAVARPPASQGFRFTGRCR